MRSVLLRTVGFGFILALSGCEDNTGTAPTDYQPLLRTLTDQVTAQQGALSASADKLVTRLKALEDAPDQASLAAAQAAWRATRTDYRKLDAAHFGPIEDQGISERIDVAPVRPNDVEDILAGDAELTADTVANAGGSAKGFLGIEYLIFSTDGDDAALADLQGDGLPSRRRTLARLMGEEVAQSVHELEDAWSPTGGDYAGMIERAGSGSTRYRSQRAAVDDYVGGVAYALELVVGVRLAAPLGRKTTGEPDPTQDPTPRSDSSVPDMSASLDGVSVLYQNEGFSAQVRGRVPALDDQAKQELGDCSDKVQAIPAPFAIALTEQTTLVQAAYDSCKSLKATWNVDVTSAIGATLRVGDNDGD